MTNTISDLSGDLVGKILSRVPLTSLRAVRSTCKTWKALSKNKIIGKAAIIARNQFLGFTLMNFRVCSMKLDLQGIRNYGYFSDLSIKQLNIFNQVKIAEIFHCDDLLLCVTNEVITRLVIWNPYSGETRWIQPRKVFYRFDMYALGYDNNNHKILTWNGYVVEIYDCNSNSWTVLDVTPALDNICYQGMVSLKGNIYFVAAAKISEDTYDEKFEKFVCGFDFTAEKFGPRLPLPSQSCSHVLSCVRDEQLASLHETFVIMEICITTKIDPDSVSWSKFLKVDKRPLTRFLGFFMAESLYIDEEKKVVVVSSSRKYTLTKTSPYKTVYIIGEDGYFKSVNIGEPDKFGYNRYDPLVFSSYVRSLVQLKGEKEIIN